MAAGSSYCLRAAGFASSALAALNQGCGRCCTWGALNIRRAAAGVCVCSCCCCFFLVAAAGWSDEAGCQDAASRGPQRHDCKRRRTDALLVAARCEATHAKKRRKLRSTGGLCVWVMCEVRKNVITQENGQHVVATARVQVEGRRTSLRTHHLVGSSRAALALVAAAAPPEAHRHRQHHQKFCTTTHKPTSPLSTLSAHTSAPRRNRCALA